MAMNNREMLSEEELEWQRRRKERVQRMKLEKEKQLKRQKMFKMMVPVAAVILLVVIVSVAAVVRAGKSAGEDAKQEPHLAEAEKAENSRESSQESCRESSQESSQENSEESGQDESVSAEQSQQSQMDPAEAIAMQSTGVVNVADSLHSVVTQAPAIATSTTGTYEAHITEHTAAPPAEVNSTNVVFIDLESGEVLAQKNYKEMGSPASMTKVLTLLVAAEHVTNLEDTFTMTIEITDYSFVNDCSNVGFEVGEVVTVRDLLYGTILPSGGDAAVGLATYVAGSHEAFVDMMNEKLEELGLSDTAHFTNCVGLYDENHYCSVYDMAMIMEAALENDLCREILGARTYTTSVTPQHPEGITVSNWFIRRIEDKDTGGEVLGAKTGYVNESGSCAVSYGVDAAGKGYVCATTGAHSSWRCIYDHVALYKKYAKE